MMWCIFWGPKQGQPTGHSGPSSNLEDLEDVVGVLKATYHDKTYWIDRQPEAERSNEGCISGDGDRPGEGDS